MTGSAESNGYVLPNAAQTTLIHAALDTGGDAQGYFDAWAAMIDFEGKLDEGSFNILPLVWATLAGKDFDHKLMPRLKGIFRNSWVKGTRRTMVAEALLRDLRRAGIPTLCVKGLPLGLTYYARPALRPMNDIDIVVPPDLVPAARRVLHDAGFLFANSNWRVDRPIRHAVQHMHPERGELDLHWHVLFECPQKRADAHFWDSAVPLQVGSEASLQPCATDLLLHVIVHGIRWNPFPPMRWITDAAAILRSEAAIDWSRFVAFADEFQLGMRLSLGLDILRQTFGLPIPGDVVVRLARQTNLVERIELLALRGSDERSSWRHVRRGTYVLRMTRGEDAGLLPGALVREVMARWRGQRSRSDRRETTS